MKKFKNIKTLYSREDLNHLLKEFREDARYYLEQRKIFRNHLVPIKENKETIYFKISIAAKVEDVIRLSRVLKLSDEAINKAQEMIDICDNELRRLTKRVKNIESLLGIKRKSAWEEQNDWFIKHKEEIQKKEKAGIPWDSQYFEYLASKE